MSASLHRWHTTVFADFQRAHTDDRSAWHAWCGQVEGIVIDLGCGASKMVAAIGVDLAFGDVRADCLHLPFADDSVDVIVSTHLIEHVEPAALIAECARVLKGGGRLLIEGPNLCGPSRALRVWRAGCRDSRYPLGARSRLSAILKGIFAYRHAGRVNYREPRLDVDYPGKDPDAVWWSNYWGVVGLIKRAGFLEVRSSGRLGHTFRLEAERES